MTWFDALLARGSPLGYIAFDLTVARAAVAEYGGWFPLPLGTVYVTADEEDEDDD